MGTMRPSVETRWQMQGEWSEFEEWRMLVITIPNGFFIQRTHCLICIVLKAYRPGHYSRTLKSRFFHLRFVRGDIAGPTYARCAPFVQGHDEKECPSPACNRPVGAAAYEAAAVWNVRCSGSRRFHESEALSLVEFGFAQSQAETVRDGTQYAK